MVVGYSTPPVVFGIPLARPIGGSHGQPVDWNRPLVVTVMARDNHDQFSTVTITGRPFETYVAPSRLVLDRQKLPVHT